MLLTQDTTPALEDVDRPGKWLVFTKYEFETPQNPDIDYANYRAYMMFEIKKRRR